MDSAYCNLQTDSLTIDLMAVWNWILIKAFLKLRFQKDMQYHKTL